MNVSRGRELGALGELSEDRQDDPQDRSMDWALFLPRPPTDGHEAVVLFLDRNASLDFKDDADRHYWWRPQGDMKWYETYH